MFAISEHQLLYFIMLLCLSFFISAVFAAVIWILPLNSTVLHPYKLNSTAWICLHLTCLDMWSAHEQTSQVEPIRISDFIFRSRFNLIVIVVNTLYYSTKVYLLLYLSLFQEPILLSRNWFIITLSC